VRPLLMAVRAAGCGQRVEVGGSGRWGRVRFGSEECRSVKGREWLPGWVYHPSF
jgi:hypothetical protein